VTGDTADPRTVAVRIESLVAELGASGDARVRAASEDLVRQLMQLYGAGLARILDLAYEHDQASAPALFERLADDPLVASLLALHGLHPHGVERRLARAIDRIRPVVDAAGAQLSVIEVSEASIRLRLGILPGVTAAAVDVRPLVERVVAEAVPEVPRVEFEGTAPRHQLIQITR
jgi:hypothetical protein